MNEREIFVVDDDESIRHLFIEAFKRKGYKVRSAESAEKALEILEKESFHVIFLDLKLPGMSGVELCRLLKKKTPEVVIFAITAYASIFELSDCLEAGFNDYFTKPVTLDALYKATEDAFNGLVER